jgi:hypothetical protein
MLAEDGVSGQMKMAVQLARTNMMLAVAFNIAAPME